MVIAFVGLTACQFSAKFEDLASSVASPKAPPGRSAWGQDGLLKFSVADKRSLSPQIVAIQPDGKILVWQNSVPPQLHRLNANGGIDKTFGVDGFVTAPLGVTYVTAMAASTQGIYTLSMASFPSGASLMKYDVNGNVDLTFGTLGKAALDPVMGDAFSMSLLANGKILVSGIFYSGTSWNPRLARLNADGTLDSSYGTSGVFQYNSMDYFNAAKVSVFPDGSTWLTAAIGNPLRYVVMKISSDGTLDTTSTFATGTGVAAFWIPSRSSGVTHNLIPLSSGKMIIAGYSQSCSGSCTDYGTLVRLNADGSIDNSFNSNGIVQISNPSSTFSAHNVVEIGGGLRVFGTGRLGYDPVAAQLFSDGSLDSSFGVSGLKTDFSLGLTGATPTAFLINGSSLYVAGYVPQGTPSYGYATMSKTDFSFNLDNAFGSSGHSVYIGGKSLGRIRKTIALSDGKTLIAGDVVGPLDTIGFVARLNEDGSFDPSFGTAGVVIDLFGEQQDAVTGLGVLPDGHFVVGGSSASGQLAMTRLNSDGSRDTSFGIGGVKIHSFAGFWPGNSPFLFGVTAQGKILAVFSDNGGPKVVRLLDDGSFDSGFSGDGVFDDAISVPGAAYSDPLYSLAQPNGKILIAGSCDDTNGDPCAWFMRLNSDGSLDSGFGTAGFTVIVRPNAWELTPMGLALAPSGKIYSLAATGSGDEGALIGLNSDGSVNTALGGSGLIELGVDFHLDSNAWQRPFIDVDETGNIYGLGLDADEKLVIGAWNPDGNPLSGFGVNGRISVPSTVMYRDLSEFHRDANGDFKIVAEDSLHDGILRVHSDGTID